MLFNTVFPSARQKNEKAETMALKIHGWPHLPIPLYQANFSSSICILDIVSNTLTFSTLCLP